MPLHDWTKARPGMFPDFHSSWLTYLKNALNHGLLPGGYFAMSEQRTSLYGPDVLTLTTLPRRPANPGGVAVAEPKAARKLVAHGEPVIGRAVAVRHASSDRVVAVVEVVSPANKDRPESVGDFAGKVVSLVANGVHVVVVDILPPGRHDPDGLHAVIWPALDPTDPEAAPPPADQPFTMVGYKADRRPVAYLSYTAIGQPLPSVPLFLDDGVFVDVPLEQTYLTNFAELPAELKSVLEPA